jgi:uncharacterized protein YkwD
MLRKKIAACLCVWFSALLLSACGGGSGGDTSTPTTSTTPATETTAATTALATPAVTAPTAVSSDVTCGIVNFQNDLIASINTRRGAGAVCGGVGYPAVGAVAWDGQLQNAATAHSTDMAAHNFFSHTGSDGSTLRQRVPAAGYDYRKAGENIAAGQMSVAQVVADWMASPSHCVNMMQPEFRDLGVSCKTNAASDYKIYWTLELGVR